MNCPKVVYNHVHFNIIFNTIPYRDILFLEAFQSGAATDEPFHGQALTELHPPSGWQNA
jgi:hypothetical protein